MLSRNETDQSVWADSIKEFIKETKIAETTKVKKREKSDIKPGTSVTSEVLKDHQTKKLKKQKDLKEKKSSKKQIIKKDCN